MLKVLYVVRKAPFKKKKKSEESKLILLYAIANSIADSTVDSFQIHFEVPFFDGC